jgi:uncharacterized protein (TIGR00255 family)
MIRSMTGFGRASGAVGRKFTITVTARSVNHKYLELGVRLPEALWELEGSVRSLAAEKLTRGKVDVSVRVARSAEPEYDLQINRKIVRELVPRIRELVEEFAIEGPLTAGDLLRFPDVVELQPLESEIEDDEREAFRAVVGAALDRLLTMRATEGESLQADLEARLATVGSLRTQLAGRRETVLQESIQSYRLRVDELARGAGIAVDPDRLAQETVILAERSDIAEELTRLESHVRQAEGVIRGGEPAGKKLDFLSQEMLREINTLGQKSRSAEFRSVVVELKTEVERIREQVQNVE